jgi:hypothetical protein
VREKGGGFVVGVYEVAMESEGVCYRKFKVFDSKWRLVG